MQDPAHGSFGPFRAPTKTLYSELPNKNPVTAPADAKALPLDWLLDPEKRPLADIQREREACVWPTIDRILARLIQSEANEAEAVYRDDYRISWLTVRFCQTGEAVRCTPHVLATYKVLGCHPDQVWFRINERRIAMLGKCRIGAIPVSTSHPNLSAGATGESQPTEPQSALPGSFSPRKPSQSVKPKGEGVA